MICTQTLLNQAECSEDRQNLQNASNSTRAKDQASTMVQLEHLAHWGLGGWMILSTYVGEKQTLVLQIFNYSSAVKKFKQNLRTKKVSRLSLN
jgi:hypothetical protein